MARYQIRHTSHYSYDQPVTTSFNEARLTPQANRWQTPLDSVLRADAATWHYRYIDYWGTEVRVFEANTPHRDLVVEAASLVEVDPQFRAQADTSLAWADVRSAQVVDRRAEFLALSSNTKPPRELADLSESIAAHAGPHDTAHQVSGAIHEAMSYQPGSTGVHTLASQAWEARSGVCQDYAHLLVGALRHVGLPARYVSGYLHPSSDPVLGEAVSGESHAWVEWWLGEWHAYDPTNASPVGERHVMVGTGRDYADVPPIKGILAGTPVTTDLHVDVTLTRLV